MGMSFVFWVCGQKLNYGTNENFDLILALEKSEDHQGTMGNYHPEGNMTVTNEKFQSKPRM